jgi:hypothetical protein
MTALILWFKGIKNAVFAAVAATLGAGLMFFRWSAARHKRQAEEAKEVAKGYEAADAVRTKADKAVRKVTRQAKAQPKPDTKKRGDLESSEW